MSKENSNLEIFGFTGSIWAGILSYLKWHSFGWAIFHSTICGWFYVIYYFIRY